MTRSAGNGRAVRHGAAPRTRYLAAAAVVLWAAALFAPSAAGAAPPPRTPSVSLRGFGDVTYARFAAKQTFSAIFGSSTGIFAGGGAQVVFRNGLYVELGISRFRKTGQRAYVYNGQSYGLGIPLTATVTPIDLTAGYRLFLSRRHRLILYGGGGINSTGYTETSQFTTAAQNVSTRAIGYQMQGGVEFRLGRWFGVAGELQYRRIPGIIGKSGVSQAFGESNLGGLDLDVKFIVGRTGGARQLKRRRR